MTDMAAGSDFEVELKSPSDTRRANHVDLDEQRAWLVDVIRHTLDALQG
jgi:hypothetical protein